MCGREGPRPCGRETGEDARPPWSGLLISPYDSTFHVGMLEGLVFQRHRHRAIKNEEDADTKFAAQTGRKPDSIFLTPIVNREAKTGKVDPHKLPHAKWERPRELCKNVDRLELLGIDVGLAGPIRVIVVLRSEGNVVALPSFERFVIHQAKLVFLLLVAW